MAYLSVSYLETKISLWMAAYGKCSSTLLPCDVTNFLLKRQIGKSEVCGRVFVLLIFTHRRFVIYCFAGKIWHQTIFLEIHWGRIYRIFVDKIENAKCKFGLVSRCVASDNTYLQKSCRYHFTANLGQSPPVCTHESSATLKLQWAKRKRRKKNWKLINF